MAKEKPGCEEAWKEKVEKVKNRKRKENGMAENGLRRAQEKRLKRKNKLNTVRTIDAFTLVLVLIIDYCTFICNLLL